MADPVGLFASVIVATYNQANYLPKCLDSLLGQTATSENYEIIVVDDGSKDETEAILASYRSRIKSISHTTNRGLAAACNTGVGLAQGHYVIRVDSDDWLARDALQNLLDAAEARQSPEIVVPYYWIVRGEQLEVARPDLNNLFSWVAGGPLLHRETVVAAGAYRDFYWEEYDLYLRMLSRGARAELLEIPVLYYRKHSSSMTAHGESREKGWRELMDAWPMETLRRYGLRGDPRDALVAPGQEPE